MKGKKVSNYELFFDLVFILATSGVVGILHSTPEHIVSFERILSFVVSTLSIWHIWLLENSYLNRYSKRDANDVFTIIAAMLVLGNMVSLFSANFETGIISFNGISIPVHIYYNILMIITMGIIFLQYQLHIQKYHQCTSDMIIQKKGIVIAIVIVVVSTFIAFFSPNSLVGYIYFIAYSVCYIYPNFMVKKMEYPYMNFPHLVERMQLITILTVGELVIAIIKTYPLSEHFLLSILTFVMVGFLFVSYVYQTAIRMNHHQEVAAAPLVYLHIAILIAINIITAGVEMYYEGQLLNIGVSMILIGITVFYLCLYGTTRYNKDEVQLTKEIIKAYILVYLICTTLAIIFNRNTEIFYLALAIQAVLMVFISVDYRREED